MNKNKSIVLLSISVVLIIFIAVFSFMPVKLAMGNYDYHSPVNQLVHSLDFANGNYITFDIENADEDKKDETISVLQNRMKLIEERLGVQGISQAILSTTTNTLSVQIPDDEEIDMGTMFNILGSQGDLVISLNEDGSEPFIPYDDEGNELSWAECIEKCIAIYDNTASKNPFGISFTVNEFGLNALKEGTAGVTSESTLHFIMDGDVIGKPNLQNQITNRTNQITGYDSVKMAQTLAIKFISGMYPLQITNTMDYQTVNPTLGENALLAIGIALLVVLVASIVVFIVKHGLLGVASSLSLMIFIILLVLSYAYLPLNQYFSLSAAVGVLFGICVFVAYNLVFCRLIKRQYNLSDKKTFDTAFSEAYSQLLKVVIDSGVCILLAAIAFWIISVGVVSTIAMAVVFSIVLSAICVLLFTRGYIKRLRKITQDDKKFKLSAEVK